MDKRLPLVYCRVATNVSKKFNTLLIDEWYIGIFEIDT